METAALGGEAQSTPWLEPTISHKDSWSLSASIFSKERANAKM